MEKEAKVSSTLLGHKARCFDVRLNPFDSSQLLTSSEDGHARLWDINRKTCLQALCHNKDAEVLRAAFVSRGCIVTAGSDGIVKIWRDEVQSKQGTDARASLNNGSVKTNFVNSSSLDHGGSDFQVYVCEPYISTSSAQNAAYLLTGVENRLILWSAEDFSLIQEWTYFDSREEAFGGNHRNPDKQNFVFDAKWHPHDSTKAVIALSDGSLSFVDTRLPQEDHLAVDLHDEDVHLGHPTSVRHSLDMENRGHIFTFVFISLDSLGWRQALLCFVRERQRRDCGRRQGIFSPPPNDWPFAPTSCPIVIELVRVVV